MRENALISSMFGKLKDFIREQNQFRRLLWLRSLYAFGKFYPGRRLYNILYYLYLIVVRKYQPLKLDSSLRNGVFYLCLVEKGDETLLLKFPHLKNWHSYSLCKKLRDSKAFDDYSCTLKSLSNDTILGKHIPIVKKVRRDGGYWSSYVEGYNISIIQEMSLKGQGLPDGLKLAELIHAIDELLRMLRIYEDHHGQIIGDWGISNLIYDTLTHRVLNVDLEGFWMYGKDRLETNILYIEAVLGSFKEMLRIQESQIPNEIAILKTLSLVKSATKADVSYNGQSYPSGYHSLTLRDRYFRGQRECAARFATVPYDFTNKVVLDLGCNCGGVLHHLADRIQTGVGLDRDSKLINAANSIKFLNGANNLHFFIFDMDKDNLDMIDNFMLDKRVDVCFLLSICMWLKQWKSVVTQSSRIAKTLLFESNGTVRQQAEQVEFLHERFAEVAMISSESSDDLQQSVRALYLCKNVASFQ